MSIRRLISVICRKHAVILRYNTSTVVMVKYFLAKSADVVTSETKRVAHAFSCFPYLYKALTFTTIFKTFLSILHVTRQYCGIWPISGFLGQFVATDGVIDGGSRRSDAAGRTSWLRGISSLSTQSTCSHYWHRIAVAWTRQHSSRHKPS